jgi:hypothetical protein
MRIISKFRDYYDSVAASGIDKETVYVRTRVEPQELPSELVSIDKSRRQFNGQLDGEYTVTIIGFCGKLYPVVVHEHYNSHYQNVREVYHSHNELMDHFEKVKKANSSTSYQYSRALRYENLWFVNISKRFFGDFGSVNYESFFLDNKLVSFSLANSTRCSDEYNGFVINPVLKDYDIFKIIDPWTAFQEISMFIGGVLGSPNKPITQIADIDMVVAKGFDKKLSFRKAPTKKRK